MIIPGGAMGITESGFPSRFWLLPDGSLTSVRPVINQTTATTTLNPFTENGALSLNTTNDARLNFFFSILRSTNDDKTINMLSQAWRVSPIDTLRLVFHLRDCRGGKGEKKQFYTCMQWLLKNCPETVMKNLLHIPFFGSFNDFWKIFYPITPETKGLVESMIKYYASVLKDDYEKTKTGSKITLAGKWAPSENRSHDNQYHSVKQLCRALNMSHKQYRQMLVALRKQINIPETLMCANQWTDINYSSVASLAMKKYRKAFKKHAEERFQSYLNSVELGHQKINAGQLFPHQLVENYDDQPDQVIELQWNSLLLAGKKLNKLNNYLCVVDVSGSMDQGNPNCMDVAVGLGLYLSNICSGHFNRKVITFSQTPTFHYVTGDNLFQQVHSIKKAEWGMNTNLQAVFDRLLDDAIFNNLSPEQMPSTIIIFSDMQFDAATKSNTQTNFETIDVKYASRGYIRPNLVFWNLAGRSVDFPVAKGTTKTALVSGFSPALMSAFIDGESMEPYTIMRRVIDNRRYDILQV